VDINIAGKLSLGRLKPPVAASFPTDDFDGIEPAFVQAETECRVESSASDHEKIG